MTALEEIKKALEDVTPERVERLWWFLHILAKSTGTTNAEDDKWNWINAFCTDYEDDTFNLAAKLGFISVRHDSFMETSTARITKAGLALVAHFDKAPSSALTSTLESLQRENEEKSAWIKSATTEITKAIGGGSEMFTPHGDEFRVDPAFVASFIQYRRERHAESKKASIQKERELLARAEAAEAEVKREAELATHMANDCNEAQAEAKKLREALQNVMGCYDTPLSRRRFPPDDFMSEALEVARQALASTGGEHHAE